MHFQIFTIFHSNVKLWACTTSYQHYKQIRIYTATKTIWTAVGGLQYSQKFNIIMFLSAYNLSTGTSLSNMHTSCIWAHISTWPVRVILVLVRFEINCIVCSMSFNHQTTKDPLTEVITRYVLLGPFFYCLLIFRQGEWFSVNIAYYATAFCLKVTCLIFLISAVYGP